MPKKHHNKSQTPTKTQSCQMPSPPGQPEATGHTEFWSTLVSIKSYTSQSNAKYHQYLILQRQVTEKDFSNMRFLYQVVHNVCSLFLKHKQQQFKWSHCDGWRLVKNGCSGVSHPRVSQFCYLNFTCEDYQVPKALKKCLQSTVMQNGTQASKEEAIS